MQLSKKAMVIVAETIWMRRRKPSGQRQPALQEDHVALSGRAEPAGDRGSADSMAPGRAVWNRVP